MRWEANSNPSSLEIHLYSRAIISMDDVQRERMERNRQAALERLRARNGSEASQNSRNGGEAPQNSQSTISADVIECKTTVNEASVAVEKVPRRSPSLSKRRRVDRDATQSKLSSSLGIIKPSQDFDYVIAIDFECTCDHKVAVCPQEIIEFPAILVNVLTRKVESIFHTFVKPVYHPMLTDFCKRFTGIQQNQVDDGVLLGKAIQMLDSWLEKNDVKSKRFVVATWSDWDCGTMLDSECLYKGLKKPLYYNRWINLKVPHREIYGSNVKANFRKSIEMMGLIFEGRPHSGLADAKNTAYMALEMIKRGTRLRVTGWLKAPGVEPSKPAFPKKRKKPASKSKSI